MSLDANVLTMFIIEWSAGLRTLPLMSWHLSRPSRFLFPLLDGGKPVNKTNKLPQFNCNVYHYTTIRTQKNGTMLIGGARVVFVVFRSGFAAVFVWWIFFVVSTAVPKSQKPRS